MTSDASHIISESYIPKPRPELKPFIPLSRVPENENPIDSLDMKVLIGRLNQLQEPTGDKALLIILELIGVMPASVEAADQAKRLSILYAIEKAKIALEDYYEEAEKSKQSLSAINSELFEKTEKYENTPILVNMSSILLELRGPNKNILKKYELILQNADRIARMQLLLEAELAKNGLQI